MPFVTDQEQRLKKIQRIFGLKDGRVIGVNKNSLYENPFFLQTNVPNNNVSFTANRASTPIPMTVGGEGPMQLSKIGIQRDGTCLIFLRIQDGKSTRALMNSACHVDAIAGTGAQPYRLPEALYLDELRVLIATYTDLSGSANNARINMPGAKYSKIIEDPTLVRIRQRIEREQYLTLPFFYTLDAGSATLAAAETVNSEITIANDHSYLIHQISFVSTGSFNVDIIDQAKGESLINAPSGTHYGIPHLLLCGNNNYPYRFHEPVLVFPGQKLQIQLTDTSGIANTIFFVLGGQFISARESR